MTEQADLQFLAAFLKTETGIIIAAEKAYLVDSRLTPVANKHGLKTVAAVIDRLKLAPPAPLKRDVVEAMTTNETSFFRDGTPFEALKNHIFPGLVQRRASGKRLRILCAAASTGQEPYSIAMLFQELGLKDYTLDIVATDLDSQVLARAASGVYTKFEVQRGLPIKLMVKYFTQTGPDAWTLKPEIRRMVNFREYNLLNSDPALGQFDVVFCRNVLIYFDPPTKKAVLERLARHMAPDASLFLGGAETVFGITEAFAPGAGLRGVYVHKAAAAAAAVITKAAA